MTWIRRHKGQSAAAAAVVAGALIMAYALATLLFGGSGTIEPERPVAAPSIEAPRYVEPDDLGLTDAESAAGLPPLSSGGSPGSASGLGLGGEGGIVGVPRRDIVLSMTSAAPIAYVGYFVPTSLDSKTGTVRNPGTSWSKRFTGYGPPDFAQMFSISGPTGVPVTCTVTVDGKVTERRTTTGPYDQMFCQG